MDRLPDIALDTDLEAAASLLDQPRPEPQFAIGRNLFHARKAEITATRRGIKALIRPENARAVLDHLPVGADDRTHCVLRGDFVLCDLIPAILAVRGAGGHVRIATLGMSIANADSLAQLVEHGRVAALTIVVSQYFQQIDKATTFREVEGRLAGVARLVITRSHAKVILLPTARGDHYSIEGSANLRSSDHLEQMLILNDQATHDFHAAWIDQLAAAA